MPYFFFGLYDGGYKTYNTIVVNHRRVEAARNNLVPFGRFLEQPIGHRPRAKSCLSAMCICPVSESGVWRKLATASPKVTR